MQSVPPMSRKSRMTLIRVIRVVREIRGTDCVNCDRLYGCRSLASLGMTESLSQPHKNSRPFTGGAFCADSPSVRLDEMPHDGEPEPSAAVGP
jgi:hypothetical protein